MISHESSRFKGPGLKCQGQNMKTRLAGSNSYILCMVFHTLYSMQRIPCREIHTTRTGCMDFTTWNALQGIYYLEYNALDTMHRILCIEYNAWHTKRIIIHHSFSQYCDCFLLDVTNLYLILICK